MIGELFQSLQRDLIGDDNANRRTASAPFRMASGIHNIQLMNSAQSTVAFGLDGGHGLDGGPG